MSMNSRRRGCFFASAISAPAELTRQMFGTSAFLLAATNSIVMSNLSLCVGGMMHKESAPDSSSVAVISFIFPGLCGIMVTPSFWSSLHFADVGCRVSPQTESTLLENFWSVRSSSAIKKPVCPSMAEIHTLRGILAAAKRLSLVALFVNRSDRALITRKHATNVHCSLGAVIMWWSPFEFDEFLKAQGANDTRALGRRRECYAMTTLKDGSTYITIVNIHLRLGTVQGIFRRKESKLRSRMSGNGFLLGPFGITNHCGCYCCLTIVFGVRPCAFLLAGPTGIKSQSKHMCYCRIYVGCTRKRSCGRLRHW